MNKIFNFKIYILFFLNIIIFPFKLYSFNISSFEITKNLGLKLNINNINNQDINNTYKYKYNNLNIFNQNLGNYYRIKYNLGFNIYNKIYEKYNNLNIFPYINININNINKTKCISIKFIPYNNFCNYNQYQMTFNFKF